ncbi:MAG: hypothetical protein ACREIV_12915, partial [Planctomycetaceae bacterium]
MPIIDDLTAGRMRHPVLLLAIAAAVGCGDAGADPLVATVRDSAGIRIIENVVPDSGDVAWWILETPALVDIGGVDADEAHALYRVGGARRLSDGRIVVSNGGSGEVRWYGADGTYLRTSGRRGDGPGEFQRPGQIIGLPADTVMIADGFGRRVTVLDPAGEFVRDFQPGGADARATLVDRLDDGTLIARAVFTVAGEDLQDGMMNRPDVNLVALSPGGELQDTITSVPGTERFLRMTQSGGEIQSIEVMTPPFRQSTT